MSESYNREVARRKLLEFRREHAANMDRSLRKMSDALDALERLDQIETLTQEKGLDTDSLMMLVVGMTMDASLSPQMVAVKVWSVLWQLAPAHGRTRTIAAASPHTMAIITDEDDPERPDIVTSRRITNLPEGAWMSPEPKEAQ